MMYLAAQATWKKDTMVIKVSSIVPDFQKNMGHTQCDAHHYEIERIYSGEHSIMDTNREPVFRFPCNLGRV